jgi:hypothetical protein
LGIGEAVVTVMNERGAPTPVAWTRLRAPESRMGPADPDVMAAVVTTSPLSGKYAQAIDRESARELLAKRLETGAAKAQAEIDAKERAEGGEPERISYPEPSRPKSRSRSRAEPERTDGLTEVLQSQAAKQFMRTAAREIARGLFNVGRR